MRLHKIKQTIVVNFKKLTGGEAIGLAEKLNGANDSLLEKYNIILAVQAPDAIMISRNCKFEIYVQDTFSHEKDCFLTFFDQPENEISSRIAGVILNHPEKKLTAGVLRTHIQRAVEWNIPTLICATTIAEAKEVNKFSPRYIGIESEALIGKDESFIHHCPEIVRQAKLEIEADILIGAGIKTSGDLRHVINTGGSGVLVSSLILKSNDPSRALNNFLN